MKTPYLDQFQKIKNAELKETMKDLGMGLALVAGLSLISFIIYYAMTGKINF